MSKLLTTGSYRSIDCAHEDTRRAGRESTSGSQHPLHIDNAGKTSKSTKELSQNMYPLSTKHCEEKYNYTCENSTVLCTVCPGRRGTAGAVTAARKNTDHHTPAYNWNVRHSDHAENLGHVERHERERLLELELHDHRGITHLHGHNLLLDRGTTAASISIPPWPGGGTSTDQCMPAIDASSFPVSM